MARATWRRGAAVARARLTLGALLWLASACGDAPGASSAQCLADEGCAPCAWCVNGRCTLDEDRPRCVTTAEDPCDGVDNDGNGIIDDPDACWAPVYAFAGPDGARCYGASAAAPPSACAGYTASSDQPAFTLAGHGVPGLITIRQCSRGDTHVLLRVPSAGADAADEDMIVDPIAGWEAAGYACGPPLGYAHVDDPGVEAAETGHGASCPLSRHVTADDEAAAARYVEVLGRAAPPEGAVCDAAATVWVVSDAPDCEGATPAPCPLARCPDMPEATLVAQEIPSGAVLDPHETVIQRWTVRNTGATTWPGTWRFARDEGGYSARAQSGLGREVPVGETITLASEITAPGAGVDLRDAWVVQTSDGHRFGHMGFGFDVHTLHAGHLAAVEPAAGADYPPRYDLVYTITLDNAGATTWSEDVDFVRIEGETTGVDAIAPEAPILPGHRWEITLPARTPDGFGDVVERWRLEDAGGDTIPIDGGAEVAFGLRVIGDRRAHVVAESHPAGVVVQPGVPFLRMILLENRGDQSWPADAVFRQVALAELTDVRHVRLNAPVAPGGRFLLAIPMRVPHRPTEVTWRDGWTFYDADDGVIPIVRADAAGRTYLGPSAGAWLWTRVRGETPCAKPPPDADGE